MPLLPPPPPSRPSAPPARHRRRRCRARVTNAPGDREPRAPPSDSWRPAADGDWRGTLVQPPAQPVIKNPRIPPGHCLSFLLYSALPESLLPRTLEELALLLPLLPH